MPESRKNASTAGAALALGRLRPVEFRRAGAQARDQLAAEVDRVLVRIEAADQERVDAELVVFEQRARDLLGRADQARRVAHRAGRLGDRHPQPLVVRLALRGEVEQAARRRGRAASWRCRSRSDRRAAGSTRGCAGRDPRPRPRWRRGSAGTTC